MSIPMARDPDREFGFYRVLSIAGSDSGGGAGIQADLKTIGALGAYGMSAVTAVTCQNTLGVQNIYPLPARAVSEQIDAIMTDIGIDAIKIGMLHSQEMIRTVVDAIKKYSVDIKNIVLDPVMVSASGDSLIEEDTVDCLIQELFPIVDIVTPNLDEATLILKKPVKQIADLADAVQDLLHLVKDRQGAVLLKGGHLAGKEIVDLLAINHPSDEIASDLSQFQWKHDRIETRNIHGSGCTLSSAIAVYLAFGYDMKNAVEAAHSFVYSAIKEAQGLQLGSSGGNGPLNHFFAPKRTRSRPVI